MNFFKTSFFTGLATGIQTFAGIVISKIIAIHVGPSGFALFGQLQNFFSMLLQFTTGAITNGVVKYTAEFHKDDSEKKKIFSTALKLALIFSIPIIISLFVFSDFFSEFFFNTRKFAYVFRLFSATFFLFVLNNLLMAIMNGLQDIKRLTQAKIYTSLIGLFITVALVFWGSLDGAMIALAIRESIVFFVTLAIVLKSDWFFFGHFCGSIDKSYVFKLMKFFLMAVTGGIVSPIVQMAIRDFAGNALGWESAGHWEAMQKLSNSYLIFVTTTLSVYYLPKLSVLQLKSDVRAEIISTGKYVLPITILFAVFMFGFRKSIIVILFTREFLPMESLFGAQLLGDFFKISSWLLSTLMLAKAMGKIYIFSQLIFHILRYFFSIWFVAFYGVNGLVIAHLLNYFLYLIFTIACFFPLLFPKRKE